jgi:hypothetical protein
MRKNYRRGFIKNITLAIFSLSFITPFKSILGSVKNLPPSWIELVDIAKWCPTVHNLQPQKLKIISSTEAHLFYDPKRLLPIGDPKSIFSTVAMGIFIEHLSIAAGYFGYQVNLTEVSNDISAKKSENTLFAKLQLSERTTKEAIESSLIAKRRTSRSNYDGTPVSASLLNTLKNESVNFNNEFFHTSDKQFIELIKEINQEALFDDLNNNPIREELDNLFRYSKKEAALKKDGLWARCMGFSGVLLKSIFKSHEKWTKGISKILLKETYISSFKGTSSVGWFGGDFKNTNDYLNCGRMMARCWLLITKQGAYIHPFGSLITNERANKKINTTFKQPTQEKEIWMIFRLGYSKTPTRSYRLATKKYLINS